MLERLVFHLNVTLNVLDILLRLHIGFLSNKFVSAVHEGRAPFRISKKIFREYIHSDLKYTYLLFVLTPSGCRPTYDEQQKETIYIKSKLELLYNYVRHYVLSQVCCIHSALQSLVPMPCLQLTGCHYADRLLLIL
jgi:hypothetical protein